MSGIGKERGGIADDSEYGLDDDKEGVERNSERQKPIRMSWAHGYDPRHARDRRGYERQRAHAGRRSLPKSLLARTFRRRPHRRRDRNAQRH